MRITWNKVTWYSQIIAIVLFVSVFMLGLYLGMHFQQARDVAGERAPVTSVRPDKPINVATFKCDGGKEIQAAFFSQSVKVLLPDGTELMLPQVRSADGARYANTNGSEVFWSVGQTATLTDGSSTSYTSCKQVAAPVAQ